MTHARVSKRTYMYRCPHTHAHVLKNMTQTCAGGKFEKTINYLELNWTCMLQREWKAEKDKETHNKL